jgi:hypothetical protein
MSGDRKCQNLLRKMWDNESWTSIKEKLNDIYDQGGSIWQVWWMDGVNAFMIRGGQQ